VKLAPDDEQYSLLLQTMERFNEACNDIAIVAYNNGLANNWALHKLVYGQIREQYGLSARAGVG